MVKKNKRHWVETNSHLLEGGVGIAALEAINTMVTTSSSLSAAMVRDFNLSHPMQMQALAVALQKIIEASECCCSSSPIPVDIPTKQETEPKAEKTIDLGAVSSLETTTDTPENKSPDREFLEKALMDLLDKYHQSDQDHSTRLAGLFENKLVVS